MNKEQLKQASTIEDDDGNFKGYYLDDETLDEMAEKCGLQNEDGQFDISKVEAYFNIDLKYVEGSASKAMGVYKVIWK